MSYQQNNTQHDNTNRASLWRGDKSKNAAAPDLKGVVNINGVEHNISLWNNQKITGPNSPVMTGSIEPRQDKSQGYGGNQPPQGQGYAPPQPQQQQYQQAQQGYAPNNMNDEIPF
jgi:hypothetical protein